MKVIFLDIDGVLNHSGSKSKIHGIYFVEEKHILLLKSLVEQTGAKIVLSSTWRFGLRDLEYGIKDSINAKDFLLLKEELEKYGLEIYSRTPIKDGYRGLEILDWLEHSKELIENFVILDDDTDMKPFRSRLVQTSFMKGLEEKHIRRAIKILNEEYDWKKAVEKDIF